MFASLKNIVDVISTSAKLYFSGREAKFEKELFLDLLMFYFLFSDCIKDAEVLIAESGKDPLNKLMSMDDQTAIQTMKKWDLILRKQGARLYSLQSFVQGQDYLKILSPGDLEKIDKIIGYKMDRVVTIHGIGSALYLRLLFQFEEDREQIANYILCMCGVTGDTLNIESIQHEIEELKDALERFRKIVERLIPAKEIARLSSEAKKRTEIS